MDNLIQMSQLLLVNVLELRVDAILLVKNDEIIMEKSKSVPLAKYDRETRTLKIEESAPQESDSASIKLNRFELIIEKIIVGMRTRLCLRNSFGKIVNRKELSLFGEEDTRIAVGDIYFESLKIEIKDKCNVQFSQCKTNKLNVRIADFASMEGLKVENTCTSINQGISRCIIFVCRHCNVEREVHHISQCVIHYYECPRFKEELLKAVDTGDNEVRRVMAIKNRYPEGTDEHLKEDGSEDDKMCKMCRGKVAKVLVYDCGHLVFCFECTKQFHQKNYGEPGKYKCPMCRKDVIKLVRVF